MQSGIVGNFIFEQLDRNRTLFKNVGFETFLSKVNSSDVYFNEFQRFISKNSLTLNLAKNKEIVKRYLNAEFARQLYGENYYYQILLKEDKMVKAVLSKT